VRLSKDRVEKALRHFERQKDAYYLNQNKRQKESETVARELMRRYVRDRETRTMRMSAKEYRKRRKKK